MASRMRKKREGLKKKAGTAVMEGENLIGFTEDRDSSGVTVSTFDFSSENHFKAMDMISKLCGGLDGEALDASEIKRFATPITFLREWKHYYYKPRIIRFTCETQSAQGKDVVDGINLPQFSAVTVPKLERLSGDTRSLQSRSCCSKDFVLYVGGSVWALDWCPRIHQRSDCNITCEYLAVAAHPPESSYHNLGVPLTGRGVIQIWCVLNTNVKEDDSPPVKKPRGRPRKGNVTEESPSLKKPRGRPRKENVIEGSLPSKKSREKPRKKETEEVDKVTEVDDIDSNSQVILALSVPENTSEFYAASGAARNTHEQTVLKSCDTDTVLETQPREGFTHGVVALKSGLGAPKQRKRIKDKARVGNFADGVCPSLSTQSEDKEPSVAFVQAHNSCGHHPEASNQNMANNESLEISSTSSYLPKDAALPRVVLCLAHNGKVAWDLKWRPSNVNDLAYKHRMGYLAVLLGNGSLEVWEVPSLITVKFLYSSRHEEGTDPRFVKLEPVFRCSKLKCGDRQSIPLTVEWSPSSPHDLILAGCHDGTVAIWKFSASCSPQDTRPLLCFSADSAPIRALAWAPDESDPESKNVIVTAGHEGLRFWDIRDPYRPLWDLNPVRRVIYSLDWLPDPRCLILSVDDGTLRILSLLKAAYDVPVTGKPFVGTQQQGLHSYLCSSFSIWSVQVSRLTGMVAYCSADGTALRFQLTTKAVEKDPTRNRAPHFLCGSLTEDDSTLSVNTPLPDTPFPMKKSLNEWGDTPRSIRGFLSVSNQAKRAKDQRANDQILALCDGNDPGIGFKSGKSPAASKRRTQKSVTSRKEKPEPDQACLAEEVLENLQKGENKEEVETDIEVFPPKVVAMHRVRWNMNRGSERWLCYGGAAGIIRCQQIDVSSVAERSRVKK